MSLFGKPVSTRIKSGAGFCRIMLKSAQPVGRNSQCSTKKSPRQNSYNAAQITAVRDNFRAPTSVMVFAGCNRDCADCSGHASRRRNDRAAVDRRLCGAVVPACPARLHRVGGRGDVSRPLHASHYRRASLDRDRTRSSGRLHLPVRTARGRRPRDGGARSRLCRRARALGRSGPRVQRAISISPRASMARASPWCSIPARVPSC